MKDEYTVPQSVPRRDIYEISKRAKVPSRASYERSTRVPTALMRNVPSMLTSALSISYGIGISNNRGRRHNPQKASPRS